MVSRSARHRYRPEGSSRSGITPPDSATQPAAPDTDTPAAAAASAIDAPAIRARQNTRTRSRGSRTPPDISITPDQTGCCVTTLNSPRSNNAGVDVDDGRTGSNPVTIDGPPQPPLHATNF